MWQVALAAAVAGSGFIAKRFSNPTATDDSAARNKDTPLLEIDEQRQQTLENSDTKQISIPFLKTPLVSDHSFKPTLHNGVPEYLIGEESGEEESDGAFKFSSFRSGNPGGLTFNSKKSRFVWRKSAFRGGTKKTSGFEGKGTTLRKNVVICLKKRKTGKCNGARCTRDGSSFSWALGLGIALMSASRAEISKLSSTVDETHKMVQELKSDLCKRKPSRGERFSEPSSVHANQQRKESEPLNNPVVVEASRFSAGHNDMKGLSPSTIDDGEYASSVLTEEPQLEVMEMDQLEAELESELQKLPWCTSKDSDQMQGSAEVESDNIISDPYGGVSPVVLNQKLSYVLIKQQESHILELETELTFANCKLQEKEAELQSLKDCVRRLTEFSLSTPTDDEKEPFAEHDPLMKQCGVKEHSCDPSAVGKKRGMDFGAYSF